MLKSAGKWWKGVESGRKGRKVLESAWCIKYIRPHRYQEDLIYIHILIHCRRAWIFVTVFLDYISKLYQFLSAPTLKFQHMFTLPTHPTFAVWSAQYSTDNAVLRWTKQKMKDFHNTFIRECVQKLVIQTVYYNEIGLNKHRKVFNCIFFFKFGKFFELLQIWL